jgi:hypothetical protein
MKPHGLIMPICCSLGKLSIKYLEVNLHWKKPSKQDWQLIIDKIQSKLPI